MSNPYLISIKAKLDAAGVKTGVNEARQALVVLDKQAAKTEANLHSQINRTVGITAGNRGFKDARTDVAAYGRGLDELRAKYNPIFAVHQRYRESLADMRRAHAVGAISTEELSISSSRLRQETLSVTAALRGRTVATNTLSAASGRLGYQQQNLLYQLVDVGQMLALGQPLHMLALQQGPQIAQIYGPGEGGIGRAFSESASLIGRFLRAFAKVGIITAAGTGAVVGFAHALDDTTKLSVGMGDTILASFQVMGDGIYDAYFKPFESGFKQMYDVATWTTKTLLNSVVVTVMSIGLSVEYALLSLWTAAKSTGGNIKNFFLDILVSATNLISGGINAMITGLNTMLSSLGVDKAAELFGMPGQIKLIPELDLSEVRAETGRYKSEIIELNKTYGDAFSKLFTEDHAGKFFDLVQKKVVKNLTEEDKKADKAAQRLKDAYARIIQSAEQRITNLQLEAQTIGMTTEAINRQRYAQDLMNQVERAGIELTPARITQLRELAKEMASVEAQATELSDTYEFGKESTRGFFADLKSGIEEGKTLWASLGDAISNVFDRIANKALEAAADGVWDMIFGAFFTGGSLFDAGPGMNPANVLASANGNVMSGPGINAYSNSIVTKPTVFPFAKGIGIMGEAGTEAIMPLRRGPDGRLGVSGMVAANSNQPMVLNIYNNSSATVRKTTESDGQGGRRPALLMEDAVAATLNRSGSPAQRALGNVGSVTLR